MPGIFRGRKAILELSDFVELLLKRGYGLRMILGRCKFGSNELIQLVVGAPFQLPFEVWQSVCHS